VEWTDTYDSSDSKWKLFTYNILSVQINDISLADYIAVSVDKHATFVPHTAGRYSVKRFRKAQCPIVERCAFFLIFVVQLDDE
jgi:hypothetical protein